jgi:alpha-L-arabinofuranosidase
MLLLFLNNKIQTLPFNLNRLITLSLSLIFFNTLSFAQLATLDVTNVNTTVMNNTSLLFGITFDSRTSLTGNTSFGQFGYYQANGTPIPEVDSLFKDFPLTSIRYPGNGIAVGFDWKKSIGPLHLRPNQDLLGTQGSPQPVNFGFDEFMAMVISRGMPASEVQIMVPIYDISTSGLTLTQQRAAIANVVSNNADWVEYCNAPNDSSNWGGGTDWAAVRASNGHPAPYGVKIWNIGNEPWSGFEFGPSAANCNSYLASVTPMIDSMLARDPSIKITIPTSGYPLNPANWSHALINSSLVAQGKVYALSQHYFPTENNVPQRIHAVDNALNTLITSAAAKGVKVIVGDYAHFITSSNPTKAQKDSAMQWLGANLEADMLLMISQKSSIERVNFWTYGNAKAVWYPIRYNSIGNYTLMPAAKMYKILQPAFLDKSVAATSTSPGASDGNSYSVRSNAFVSNDLMKLNIVSVNRDKNNIVPLQVSGTTAYNLNHARLLTASSGTSEVIIETQIAPDTSGNYILPPMSILILEYLNQTISINETDKILNDVFIFPNPTNGGVHLSRTLSNITIVNFNGQIVLNQKEPTNFISTDKLSSGIYFLKSGKLSLRFIKN